MATRQSINKANQGGHPGLSWLKRRLFKKPSLVLITRSNDQHKSSRMSRRQLFTRKTTKEPLKSTPLREAAWKDLNIDLFSSMPHESHVLVVLQWIGWNKTHPLNNGYRSTPHPVTDLLPGNVIFRHGYHYDFLRITNSDHYIVEADIHDW